MVSGRITRLATTDVEPDYAKQRREKSPEEYGPNLERDKWLFSQCSKKQLPQLEKELEEKSQSEGWTPIGGEGIRDAIERLCRHFGYARPRAPRGTLAKIGEINRGVYYAFFPSK